jgi:ubiquitin-protein ligase
MRWNARVMPHRSNPLGGILLLLGAGLCVGSMAWDGSDQLLQWPVVVVTVTGAFVIVLALAALLGGGRLVDAIGLVLALLLAGYVSNQVVLSVWLSHEFRDGVVMAAAGSAVLMVGGAVTLDALVRLRTSVARTAIPATAPARLVPGPGWRCWSAVLGRFRVGSGVPVTPRHRRLAADLEHMRVLATRGTVSFRSEGDPPEVYHLMIQVPGLARNAGGDLTIRRLHRCTAYLHLDYPRRPPVFSWLTPILHPNILPPERNGGVCIGAWSAGESLADLVERVVAMVAYRSFNVDDALDPATAVWLREAGVEPGDDISTFADRAEA